METQEMTATRTYTNKYFSGRKEISREEYNRVADASGELIVKKVCDCGAVVCEDLGRDWSRHIADPTLSCWTTCGTGHPFLIFPGAE